MRKIINKVFIYSVLILIGFFMCYPLIWLFFSSFKSNMEIFSSLNLFPSSFDWKSYVDGWNGIGQMTYSRFFFNTFSLVLPTVAFTVISSSIVAYGFARFKFPLKKPLFAIMLSTIMLPDTILIVPTYLLFRDFGWLNSYLPFIVPAMFAANPFFIFMIVQFFRGLPRELDESAVIDGCNSFMIFIKILIPLSKPALFSAGIFQFIWMWNDFFNSLIYINSIKKYTLSLALRMSMDVQGGLYWNKIMAMSVITILPPLLIFFFAQKYFVEGIATTGLKA